MGQFGKLCFASAALSAALAPTAWAVNETVPPAVAALRSGKVSQATLSRPNMIYTPITPCRAFGGQAISANQIKGFLVSGSSNLTAQGGPAAGCGIPAYAKAVAINLSSGTSTAQGYLTAYATGAARPNQASLSYRAYPATTGSVVQLGTGGRINVYASAATRVTGDIAGYFESQLWAYVGPDGVLINSSGRVTSTTRTGQGSYMVTFDRNLTGCTATVSPDFTPKFMSSYVENNIAYVNTYSTGSVPLDFWFNLQVAC